MLKCKDAQARNALRLTDVRLGRGYAYADGQRNRLTADELAERQAIRTEALRLNQRGQTWPDLPEA